MSKAQIQQLIWVAAGIGLAWWLYQQRQPLLPSETEPTPAEEYYP